MMHQSVYIARLPCGCVVDFHEADDYVGDILWLHSVRGNDWTVERVGANTPVQMDCPELISKRPLKTKNMFGDAS